MLFQLYLFFKYVLGASLNQLYVLFQIADLRYLSTLLDPGTQGPTMLANNIFNLTRYLSCSSCLGKFHGLRQIYRTS